MTGGQYWEHIWQLSGVIWLLVMSTHLCLKQWLRFINTKGRKGGKISCDLHLVHLNIWIKALITGMVQLVLMTQFIPTLLLIMLPDTLEQNTLNQKANREHSLFKLGIHSN